MGDLSVPTVELEAEVSYPDGRKQPGTVFLPAGTALHSGAVRPYEWINATERFVAFRPAGGSSTLLLNKQALLSVSVAASSDPVDAPDRSPDPEVLVSLPGLELRGRLRVDLPDHHQRVLDVLNAPEAFLVLTEGSRRHLIRKAAIVHVVEASSR